MTSHNRPHACGALALVLAICVGLSPQASAAEPASKGALSPGIHGLQQVALTTRDLKRAIAFYRDKLRVPFLFESNGMAFFDLTGTRLMIGLDPQRPDGRPTSVLYFDTPDFEAAVRALEMLDVAFDGPVETVQTGERGDLRLRQFRDPDGNALAVMGTVPKRR